MASIDDLAAELAAKKSQVGPSDQKQADGGGEMRPNAPTFDEQKKSNAGIFDVYDLAKANCDMKKTEDEDEDDYQKAEDEKEININVNTEEEDEDEDEDEGEDEGEDEEEEEKAKKSFSSRDDLMKSLDMLEAAALTGENIDRRFELAEAFAKGNLNDDQREEFIQLLGVEEPEDEDTEKSFAESFSNDDQLAQDYEISPFIERQSQLVAEALDSMSGQISKSQDQQENFNHALAKSMQAVGRVIMDQHDLIKSQLETIENLQERLSSLENQPLPQRGVSGNYRQIKKSFDGQTPQNVLTPQQINAGFDLLLQKSNGGSMPLAPCGELLTHAVAAYETSGRLSQGMKQDIINALR